MAVNYDNATKAVRMTATRDALASGTLEIGTAGMAQVLTVHTLTAQGGTVSNAVWTLALAAATVAAGAAGVAAAAQIKDSGGTPRVTGLTVGTSGTDVVLDNTNVALGQNVTISAATVTHAA